MNLFIFRRDLRLKDNLGLFKIKDKITPIFIFTPEQITSKNKYKSDNAIRFMLECLNDLNSELKNKKSKLHFFYGDNIKILEHINKQKVINSITFNQDYTEYAIKRDIKIEKWCKKNKIECYKTHDYLLEPIGALLKKDKSPYKVYSPFRNNGFKIIPKKFLIKSNSNLKFAKQKFTNEIKLQDICKKLDKNNLAEQPKTIGGRIQALKQLTITKSKKQYEKTRNMLSQDTTLLSSYIKFGCLSIREVWNALFDKTLKSQLLWREFYYYITYYFPNTFKTTFQKKYVKLKWDKNPKLFKAWCQGKTGYPIVDAGMCELNTTGHMHNRARLITANFLVRILGIDWRLGEKYYAQKLIDYDPIVNNGNWQWVASVGVDTKPHAQRVFNPELQQKRYDPKKEYIEYWNSSNIRPVVEYKKEREKTMKLYDKYK